MGTVPRMCLRRTPAVDDLLSEIWELRPELERKSTTTLLLGLESFLRECQTHARSSLLPLNASAFSQDGETVVIDSSDVSAAEKDSTVSDDIEW